MTLAKMWYLLGCTYCKNKAMDILTVIYLISFAVIFWLFFKTVNYFEKI